MGLVIIRIKANSVRLDLPTGTEHGNILYSITCLDDSISYFENYF